MQGLRGTWTQRAFGFSTAQHGTKFQPARLAHDNAGMICRMRLEDGAVRLLNVELCQC